MEGRQTYVKKHNNIISILITSCIISFFLPMWVEGTILCLSVCLSICVHGVCVTTKSMLKHNFLKI